MKHNSDFVAERRMDDTYQVRWVATERVWATRGSGAC
jgi:hypothetical protein